jgi:nitrogen fixation NifU-like protein
MYSEAVLDHFRNPRNTGELPPPAVSVTVENPACGDVLSLSVLMAGDAVEAARYRVRGCTASIAAGSALTEWLRGRTRAELAALTPATIEQALGGLPPASRHAAVLCADATHALADALR